MLNKDVLGAAWNTAAMDFNNKTIDELLNDYDDMDAVRLAFFKKLADADITHYKTDGVLNVPGLGLTAGATAVTGTSTTGKIQ